MGGPQHFGGPQHMGAANAIMEEEKKEELIDMSQFDTPVCVYCMAALTD